MKDAMDKEDGGEPPDYKSKGESAQKDEHASAHSPHDANLPKKRRKVNHACVYCRRSHMTCDLERPCTRCIKRNIEHLCHDEPRESDAKRPKPGHGTSTGEESESHSLDQAVSASMGPPSFDAGGAKPAFPTAPAPGRGNPMQLVQPPPVSRIQPVGMNTTNVNQFQGFPDVWLSAQNQFQDMHHYHPNFAFIQPEVSNEVNLLSEFLHSSFMEDGAALADDPSQGFGSADPLGAGFPSASNNNSLLPPSAISGAGAGAMLPPNNAEQGSCISRPGSVIPVDKAREYYLQAADPSGNDTPEARMQKVIQAKMEAGLLKPFSYVAGYKRLQNYLDSHRTAQSSKQRILRQLDRFRPKFREKMHALTDIQIMMVETWFEKTLMEYDRVFASMAVPACCWRRTGEIFRGNKEMAELIHVPVERLRDGKIALHEILTEESVVRYWEEFGTIAFDPSHDTLLTACSLKSPDDESNDPIVNCCFSLKIRRDTHNIPSMIIGNFLPHDPTHH